MQWIAAVAISFAAAAQPLIGPETLSDPIATNDGELQVVLSKGRTSIAVAWTAFDGLYARVFVARVDGRLHVIGSVQQLPVASPTNQAGFPSIAADPAGDGFTIAWVEWAASPFMFADLNVARIDGDGTVGRPDRLWSGPAGPTKLRADQSDIWLTTGTFLFHIRSGDEPIRLARPAGDMVVLDQRPRIVSTGTQLLNTTCRICDDDSSCAPRFCVCTCTTSQFRSLLEVLSLYESDLSVTLRMVTSPTTGFDPPPPANLVSPSPPAVATDGRSLLLAWPQGQLAAAYVGLPVSDATLLSAVSNPIILGEMAVLSGPSVASDGDRYVVVWELQNDILGAVVGPDGTVTPFTVAASSADERTPTVVAAGPGTFLVAYVKSGPSDRRIAVRTMTFGMRHRATR